MDTREWQTLLMDNFCKGGMTGAHFAQTFRDQEESLSANVQRRYFGHNVVTESFLTFSHRNDKPVCQNG